VNQVYCQTFEVRIQAFETDSDPVSPELPGDDTNIAGRAREAPLSDRVRMSDQTGHDRRLPTG